MIALGITRGKKDYDGDLYTCRSKRTLMQQLSINKPLFGAVAGEQVKDRNSEPERGGE
jgi:hypothetical protein